MVWKWALMENQKYLRRKQQPILMRKIRQISKLIFTVYETYI